MGVTTRKRAGAADPQPGSEAPPKRMKVAESPQGRAPRRALASPPPRSPAAAVAAQSTAPVAKKGSRGKAFLAAAGIPLPSPAPASPAVLSARKARAGKAAAPPAAGQQAPASAGRPAGGRRNPLLQQELPKKLEGLLDMFTGLQTVYEVMRKRGHRTTHRGLKDAVEQASGKRFLLPHVGQLKQLLPEALDLEWIRLPAATAAANSSRTEPHLLITLHAAAAAEAAAAAGALPPGGGGEMQAARQLLHCRLAGHLLESYRSHLEGRAAELAAAGDDVAARQLAEAAAAVAAPPVVDFLSPFPEGVPDVPHREALPQQPDAPTPSSRAHSPVVLGGNAAAGGAAGLSLPGTPAFEMTTAAKPAGTAARSGRPPVHPGTVTRKRGTTNQRRLSFSTTAAAAGAAAPAAEPSAAALAAAAGHAPASLLKGRRASQSPLDKLASHLDEQHAAERRLAAAAGGGAAAAFDEDEEQDAAEECAATAAKAAPAGGLPESFVSPLELHPAQAGLAARLTPEDMEFGGSIPESAEAAAEERERERLLSGMPQELRRFSSEGMISLDTLRLLEASDQQHRRLSSKAAQDAREASAALGQLPRTLTRVQRIFGMQGPKALKLADVVRRIRQGGGETLSDAQVESQLRALADHAPEYVTLKPYGSCGTPALFVDRSASSNALMARLKGVAEGRLSMRGPSLGGA